MQNEETSVGREDVSVTADRRAGSETGTPNRLRRLGSFAEKHPRVTIAVFIAFTLGPFLNKAVHIDDALFVWTAEQILKHPGDFYGFNVNWYGDTGSMASINCNPPTTSYLLAAVMSVFGEREIFLHGALLLVAFAAAAGTFQLAKVWCERPLLAAFITMSAPVFLVSATTLMCDVPMLAAWIWSVVIWERALKGGKAANFFWAAVLAGLAVLIKYSALTLLPLLPILAIMREKKIGWRLIWLAMPAAMIGIYQIGTARLYGQGLITAAADYASQTRFGVTGGWLNKAIIGFVYFGGCLLPALFFAPRLWSLREFIFGGGIVFAVAMAIPLAAGVGHQFSFSFQLQLAVLLAGGIHLTLLAIAALWRRRDTISWMLVLWLASGIVFAALLNWTVSARGFLPLAPAAAILIVRSLAQNSSNAARPAVVFWPVLLSTAVSLFVAAADYQLANSTRAAARQIAAAYPSATRKMWFQGHCGFQFYYEKSGAKPVDFSRSVLKPGEMMILPANNSNLVTPDAGDVATVTVLDYPVCSWLSTVQAATGAGFYGAGGLLPFVFGPVPAERYFVFRVLRLMSFAPPESLNNLAWQLATDPDPMARDGAEAVELAQRACEASKYEKALFIGTLAAAQAEAGKFDEAIATAQRACEVAAKNGETNLVQKNQELLERYRAHKKANEE
jgi:hypothetical protein